jgi:threonine dehydratase
VKAARVRDLGARLVETGADLSAAIDAADAYAARTGAFFLNDAADGDIPFGPATIGAEILDDLPSVDAVYVPMGDTALIRGVASAVKDRAPSVRIVGVAAEQAPVYAQSWRANAALETATADTIADGLAVRRALAPNVAAIRTLVDEVRLVSEAQLRSAIEWLMAREDVIAEPAGAATTAAYVDEIDVKADTASRSDAGLRTDRDRPATIVLLVTGGNLAPGIIASADDRLRRGPDRRP